MLLGGQALVRRYASEGQALVCGGMLLGTVSVAGSTGDMRVLLLDASEGQALFRVALMTGPSPEVCIGGTGS